MTFFLDSRYNLTSSSEQNESAQCYSYLTTIYVEAHYEKYIIIIYIIIILII